MIDVPDQPLNPPEPRQTPSRDEWIEHEADRLNDEAKVRRIDEIAAVSRLVSLATASADRALRIAEAAMVYHTEQTRPIQQTNEALVIVRAALARNES